MGVHGLEFQHHFLSHALGQSAEERDRGLSPTGFDLSDRRLGNAGLCRQGALRQSGSASEFPHQFARHGLSIHGSMILNSISPGKRDPMCALEMAAGRTGFGQCWPCEPYASRMSSKRKRLNPGICTHKYARRRSRQFRRWSGRAQAATAMLEARASEARRTLRATDGAISRIERNSATELTNTSRSVVAVTVAVRRVPLSSAISPRKSPAPTSATRVTPSFVSLVTRADPLRMTMNSLPRLPSRISS